MASPMPYWLGSALKNLDLTLTLEIPLAPSGSCSSCHSISLALDGTPLPIFRPAPTISGVFTKNSMIGSLLSRDSIGDHLP